MVVFAIRSAGLGRRAVQAVRTRGHQRPRERAAHRTDLEAAVDQLGEAALRPVVDVTRVLPRSLRYLPRAMFSAHHRLAGTDATRNPDGHAVELGERQLGERHVLEHLDAQHQVEAVVREGQPADVAEQRGEPLPVPDPDRAGRRRRRWRRASGKAVPSRAWCWRRRTRPSSSARSGSSTRTCRTCSRSRRPARLRWWSPQRRGGGARRARRRGHKGRRGGGGGGALGAVWSVVASRSARHRTRPPTWRSCCTWPTGTGTRTTTVSRTRPPSSTALQDLRARPPGPVPREGEPVTSTSMRRHPREGEAPDKASRRRPGTTMAARRRSGS